MSEQLPDKTATDAVMILEALARILQASPHAITEEFSADHVQYVRSAAAAVTRAARINAEELEGARRYGGSEWDSAFLNILFPRDQVVAVYNRVNGGK